MENALKENNYILYKKYDSTSTIAYNDVLLFKEYGTTYIKRLIALPGDTLEIISNQVFINSKAIQEKSTVKYEELYFANQASKQTSLVNDFSEFIVPHKGFTISLNDSTMRLYQRTIEKNYLARIKKQDSMFKIDQTLQNHFTFTDDFYFLLGDNRNRSEDSRHLGPIKEEKIIGKMVCKLF